MRKFTILLALACISLMSFAQQERICGVLDHQNALYLDDPQMEGRMQEIENFTNQLLNNGAAERAVDGVITIPVVVHVLWNVNRPQENISMAQIESQIAVLNEDYRRLNADASETLPEFQGVAADYEIEFCLASVDPQGNPTIGVERRSTTINIFGSGVTMKRFGQGGLDAWPMDSYLNMWTCNIGFGILGFATFPGGSAANDGVVMLPNAFGSSDYDVNNDFYLSAPWDLGRTTTHEVGHWLNLRHIWGDGACFADDLVGDTPVSDASNNGCPLTHVSCGSLDMVQNYMDYTDDACMNILTEGQKARSRALFEPGGFRAALLNSNGCGIATPVCQPPFNLLAGNIEENDAAITFFGGAFADFYVVELAIWDANFEIIDTIYDPQFGMISTITYLLEGLDPCTEYSLRLSSVCSNLVGYETSETLTFMSIGPGCEPPTCDTPENLFATNVTWSQATLGWSSVEEATRYRVQGRLKGGLGLFVRTLEVEDTSFRTNPLFPFLTYEFRVQAICEGIGTSGYSGWFSFILNPFFNRENPSIDNAGLEEVKLFDTDQIVNAFPNPTSGQVNLMYNGENIENIRVLVSDITGKDILEYDLDLIYAGSSQIDLSGLNDGLYLISLKKDGIHLHTEKVILVR